MIYEWKLMKGKTAAIRTERIVDRIKILEIKD